MGLPRTALLGLIGSATLLLSGCDLLDRFTGGDEETAKETAESSTATAVPTEAPAGVVDIAVGRNTSCALLDNGGVRCWGSNAVGEHGVAAAFVDAATPVQVPGITTAEALWMGEGKDGSLACVRLRDATVQCWGEDEARAPMAEGPAGGSPSTVAGLAGAQAIAVTGRSGIALNGDGNVIRWDMASGQTLTEAVAAAETITGIEGATAIAATRNYGCAIVADGAVSCWSGEDTATSVEGITGATSIVAFRERSRSRACAATASGVQCWNEGKTPEAMEGFATGTLVTGDEHRCALAAGKVTCWGNGYSGQLGRGARTGWFDQADPAEVRGLAHVVKLASGPATTCAQTKSHEVHCWGHNGHGQLGDGTLLDRLEPVAVAHLLDASPPEPKDGSDQVQQHDAAFDWSGLPDACTKEPALVLGPPPSSREYDGMPIGQERTAKLASGYAIPSSFETTVLLADYRQDPQSPSVFGPRGEQVQLMLTMRSKAADDGIDVGRYVARNSDRTVRVELGYRGDLTTTHMLKGSRGQQSVSVTHVGEQWLCGTLDLTTDGGTFKGPWAARLPAKA